jgi:uncharacterized protein YuzE
MKVTYDTEVDVLRIRFTDAPIVESDELREGVIVDFDEDGNIVGLELLDARDKVADTQRLEFSITQQPAA